MKWNETSGIVIGTGYGRRMDANNKTRQDGKQRQAQTQTNFAKVAKVTSIRGFSEKVTITDDLGQSIKSRKEKKQSWMNGGMKRLNWERRKLNWNWRRRRKDCL